MNLQRYQEQQAKDGLDAPYTYTPISTVHTPSTSTQRKRPARRNHHDDDDDVDLDEELDDGAIAEDDDDEDWFAHKRRRKPYIPKSDRKSMSQRNISPFVRPQEQQAQTHRTIIHQQTVSSPTPVAIKPHPQLATLKPKQPMQQQTVSPVVQKVHRVVTQTSGTPAIKVDLSEKLATHSDMLRDSMLRKRETFEEELKQEIREELKNEIQAVKAGPVRTETKTENVPAENKTSSRKRGSGTFQSNRDMGNDSQSADDSPARSSRVHNNSVSKGASTGVKKPARSHGTPGSVGSGGPTPPSSSSKKKEKLYCICRTPYDNSKSVFKVTTYRQLIDRPLLPFPFQILRWLRHVQQLVPWPVRGHQRGGLREDRRVHLRGLQACTGDQRAVLSVQATVRRVSVLHLL